MIDLYKVGRLYINLALASSIDVAYESDLEPGELAVEVTMLDGKAHEYLGDDAETLREFLAGRHAVVRHYHIGGGIRVWDACPMDVVPPDYIDSDGDEQGGAS